MRLAAMPPLGCAASEGWEEVGRFCIGDMRTIVVIHVPSTNQPARREFLFAVENKALPRQP